MPMKHSTYSAIIVGSGIAGLYTAIKLSETMHLPDGILLITKSQLIESNSKYAQGGIVAVMPENKDDSVSLHISDTIKAGCGYCDFNVVKLVSEKSKHAIKDLMKYGVNFDLDDKKQINFTLEGAHSVRRILHVGGDATGYGIEKVLVDKVKDISNNSSSITVYEDTIAVELLIDSKQECRGVITYNSISGEHETVYAPVTILATGGVGQVYKYTTNPAVTTGDGVAIAIKAKAQIKDMEFIQFHPTALSIEGSDSRFLISESVRGEGARLVNDKGDYFMEEHPQKNLAPRDVVARAIFNQQANGNKVYLDTMLINVNEFKNRFPNIYKTCLANGINIENDYIPVSPAAHYCMGGIKADINGTSSIENLYAIGETACTSLHGANRLASNSLLECVVSAFELVNELSNKNLKSSKIIDETILSTIKNYTVDESTRDVDIQKLTTKLKNVMWENVGIVRTETSLLKALSELTHLEKLWPNKSKCSSLCEYEFRNLLIVSKCIVNMALKRKESIGAHYRADFVATSEKLSNSINIGVNDDTKVTA